MLPKQPGMTGGDLWWQMVDFSGIWRVLAHQVKLKMSLAGLGVLWQVLACLGGNPPNPAKSRQTPPHPAKTPPNHAKTRQITPRPAKTCRSPPKHAEFVQITPISGY